jgi:hypothetical protein
MNADDTLPSDDRRPIAFSSFHLDRRGGRLMSSGQPIPVRRKTWEVLVYLVERPGVLVTKDELLEAIWPEISVTPEVLIRSRRKRSAARPPAPSRTAPRTGLTRPMLLDAGSTPDPHRSRAPPASRERPRRVAGADALVARQPCEDRAAIAVGCRGSTRSCRTRTPSPSATACMCASTSTPTSWKRSSSISSGTVEQSSEQRVARARLGGNLEISRVFCGF